MTVEVELAQAVAGVFVGIGVLIVTIVAAYFLYQLARIFKPIADKEEKYGLLEEIALEKHASKKGIDLNKELLKRQQWKKKNFRRKVQDEILEGMKS